MDSSSTERKSSGSIHSWYDNLQRERKRGEARKDVGHASVTEAGERAGGKWNSVSSTCGRAKGRGDRGRGGHKKQDEEGDYDDYTTFSGNKAGGRNAYSSNVNDMKGIRCGETGNKTMLCHDHVFSMFSACVEERGTRQKPQQQGDGSCVCVQPQQQ